MNDIIYIRDLRVDTVIGVFDWERRIKQTLRLDIEMNTSIRQVAFTGDLSSGIDYKAVSKRVGEFVEASSFELVETLAERVAQLIISEFKVGALTLRLGKPGALRGARDVGTIIKREKSDYPPTQVFIGIGSNIEPKANILAAIAMLQAEFGTLQTSPAYASDPVGFEGDRFINLVAVFNTQLVPEAIADTLKKIERDSADGDAAESFHSRKVDIDFLLYGSYINPAMKLPRKDTQEYDFVLKPLSDLAPFNCHPETGASFSKMWEQYDKSRDLSSATLQLTTALPT
ncbi:MAG: dihydroneopterin aldolase [Gammaproteobacteria bacterium]|jgi:dihydroneopterin aldolase